MKILYVEDNTANVFLIKRVARMGKHDVIHYIDGEEALDNFKRDDPDIVLMDIQLSGELSGLDVVRKLRDQGYKTPIIAVTAYAMAGDRERFLEAGCNDYMAKPLPVPQLVNLIQHYQELISDPVLLEELTEQPASPEISEEKVVDEDVDIPEEKIVDDEATQVVVSVRDEDHKVTRVAPKVDSVKTTQEEGKV